MKVVKAKEAELKCRGSKYAKGCGSTLLVSVADLGKITAYDWEGDPYTALGYTCPLCGTKTPVNPDLSPL